MNECKPLSLGMKDATALLKKYDYNHDGQLDIDERRKIIKMLIPQLDQEANALLKTGEYTSASFLWQNLKALKAGAIHSSTSQLNLSRF